MAEVLKTNNMPGKSKKGGGLEVGSAYKMKNSMLKMSAKMKTPMQANYGSPMIKKPTLGEWFKKTKLGEDLKKLGTKMQDNAANIKHSTPKSRKKTVRKGFETASTKRSEASKKRTEQLKRFFIPKKK